MKDNVKKIPTYKKANLTNRFIAHIIDAAIMVGGMFLFYVPGIVYAFIKDGLMNGQSIGKKMMGIMVINVDAYKYLWCMCGLLENKKATFWGCFFYFRKFCL